MLTMTWAQINKPMFVKAMVSLNNSTALDSKTAYRVGRIVDHCQRAMDQAHKLEEKIRDKYISKDADGKPIKVKDEEVFNAPDAAEKFANEYKALMETNSIEIKVHKLDFNAIKGLSGGELIAIEHILENVPVE